MLYGTQERKIPTSRWSRTVFCQWDACTRIACHVPSNAIEGRRNGQNPGGRRNKVQSDKRLVRSVPALSRVIFKASNIVLLQTFCWQETEDGGGALFQETRHPQCAQWHQECCSVEECGRWWLWSEQWFRRVGLRIWGYSYNLTILHTLFMHKIHVLKICLKPFQ